jgi:hypothetical protein
MAAPTSHESRRLEVRSNDGRNARPHLRHQWSWREHAEDRGVARFPADTDATAAMAGEPADPPPVRLAARPVLAVVSVIGVGSVVTWALGLVAGVAAGTRWAYGGCRADGRARE